MEEAQLTYAARHSCFHPHFSLKSVRVHEVDLIPIFGKDKGERYPGMDGTRSLESGTWRMALVYCYVCTCSRHWQCPRGRLVRNLEWMGSHLEILKGHTVIGM